MANRILVINPFGIGDILFSTPLVSVLKKEYPKSYIGYICNIKTKDVLETNPAIDEVFVFERDEYRNLWKDSRIGCIKKFIDFWCGIAKIRFDMVIDLSLGKEYAFFCWLAGIKERRGFNYRGRGRFLTHKMPFDGFNDKPVAEYYLSLLRADIEPQQRACQDSASAFRNTVLLPTNDDRFYIEEFLDKAGIKEEKALIGIAPGGGMSFGQKDQARRRWPAAGFSKLIEKIAANLNAKMILMWGPGEEKLVNEIKSVARHNALIAPKTTIRQMAALCQKCKLVICSEGGPVHIASSQGIKTISIFGPVDEKVYGPYPPCRNNIIIKTDTGCRPCYKRFKLPGCDKVRCLEDITVDTVFEAVLKAYS